jgi:hypothetical protein
MCWVYRRVRQGDGYHLCTVGYYAPINGDSMTEYAWVPIDDCSTESEARRLVNYLNGGPVLVSDL